MRKLLLIAFLCFVASLHAQQQQASYSNPVGGNILATSANCSTAQSCVWQKLPSTATTTTVTLTVPSAFTGTVIIETSADGGVTFSAASSQTGAAVVTLATTSLTDIRVRCSAYTSGAIAANIQSSGNQQNITITAGGGVSPVTSLPGTCTPGTQVNLTSSGAALGTFVCTATGVYIPENPAQTISPYAYGAVGHVRYTYNASWATGGSTVLCSNGECNFQCPGGVYPCTSGTAGCPSLTCDAGKIVKGAAMYPQVNTNALTAAGIGVTLPQGTISTVTNSTTITVSTTTTDVCPKGALTVCTLSWGVQDDTTAINNAETAAWGNGNRCIALQLPADNFYFSGPILNGPQGSLKAGNPCSTLAAANGGSDLTNTGPSVYGAGSGTTTLIPLSSYNFAGCIFGVSNGGVSCNGTMPNLQVKDFSINGLGDLVNGVTAHNLWESVGSNAGGACDGGTTVQDVSFSNWALNTGASTVGFVFGNQSCADAIIKNIAVVMFGGTTCQYNGTQIFSIYSLYCAGSGAGLGNVFNAAIPSGTQLNIYGSEFVCSLVTGNQIAKFTGGGKLNSNGNMYRQGDGQCALQGSILLNNASLIDSTDDIIIMGTSATAGTFGYLAQNTGAVAHFRNTILNGNGDVGSKAIQIGATDKIFDDGGNTFTAAGNANTIAAGTWFGSNSVTGTTITAAKLVLSAGWGASAAWTALKGNTRYVEGTVTNTGAGQAANPTITYTFPTVFQDVSSVVCDAWQVGGTQAILAATEFLTPSALTTTGVTFTYNGTPTVNLTEVFHISCDSR